MAHWVEQGRWLGALGRASGWWIGDWIRYGNARYGERYVTAAKVTGYDVHSLMNMAYVAGRFEVARRRPGLSFSHHAEVASLPPEEQEIWLDRVEVGGLSVRAVRHELRQARSRRAARLMRALPPAENAATPPVTPPDEAVLRTQAAHEIVCPACGHHFDGQSRHEQ